MILFNITNNLKHLIKTDYIKIRYLLNIKKNHLGYASYTILNTYLPSIIILVPF